MNEALVWAYRRRAYIVTTAAAVVLALFVFWIIDASIKDHEAWVRWCYSVDGHVISDSDTTTGVGWVSDGKGGGNTVVTTSTTTDHYCLNEAGGILDIR